MSAVRIVMVLWGGLFLILGPLLPYGDADLSWLRWLGDLIVRTHHLPTMLGPETFSSAGAPWVPQEWFLGIVVAIAMAHGWLVPLSVFASAIPIGVLFSVYLRSQGRAAPEAIAAVLLFSGIALSGSFGVRAQVLGWGCFAAFLFFLQRKDAWFYAAIPTVAIWANVHASAMLALVFLAMRIVGTAADRGAREVATSRDLRILPLVAIALFCTPLGWHLPAYAVALTTSPIRQYIEEWQPVTLRDPEFLFGALPLAMLIALGGIRASLRSKAESLPIVMLFVAALLAVRNVPLFAIAAAPLSAASLGIRFPGVSKPSDRIAGLERFAIVSICIAFAVSGAVFASIRGNEEPTLLTAAIARLAAGGTQRRLFCENFNTCSVALQYPNVRVFMDGRCDPYPLDVWKAYISTIRVEPSWKSTLQRYGVNAVVASRGTRFADAVARDPSWRTTFEDPRFVVFIRD